MLPIRLRKRKVEKFTLGKRFVYISTSEVYGMVTTAPFLGTIQLGP